MSKELTTTNQLDKGIQNKIEKSLINQGSGKVTIAKEEIDTPAYDHLQWGVYDINFAIGLLKSILSVCRQYKTNTSADLQVTLGHTIGRLLSKLEIEREQLRK